MGKQSKNKILLKQSTLQTRLHNAPVFNIHKPNYEKVRTNIIYQGGLNYPLLDIT